MCETAVWLAGALRVIIAALATPGSCINPNNLRQVRDSIFSSLQVSHVWFAGDMKSERPSKDDEQHCRCVVWEEKTVLQSLVRGVHSIVRRLRTTPPRAKNQPAFFLFMLSPTEACFLRNESKANEFDRRSFATLELKLRS